MTTWLSDRTLLRARRLLGPLLIVAAFAYLFAFEVEPRDLVERMGRFQPGFVALIVLAVLGYHLLGAVSVWWLARGLRPIGFGAFAAAYWRYLGVGQWAPPGVSDASLVWLLLPRGLPAASSLAVITVDKVITLLVLVLVAVASPWLAPVALGALASPSPELAIVAGVAALAAAGVLLLRRARQLARRALSEIWSFRRAPVLLLGNLLLTLPKVALAAIALGLCAASFEAPAGRGGLWSFLVLATAARLLAFVLPTPNGIGVYEVAVVQLLDGNPFSPESLVSGALLVRLVSLGLVSLGLLVPEPLRAEAGRRP